MLDKADGSIYNEGTANTDEVLLLEEDGTAGHRPGRRPACRKRAPCCMGARQARRKWE